MTEKKGFTLVELLTVIMILGLVGLIAVPTVTKVLKNSKQKLYTSQLAMIEESGKKWGIDNINKLSETKKVYLSVNDLIAAGYIEQNSLKDPRNTKKEMNGCVVVEYSDSYNKYEYSYVEESCRTINTNQDLTSSDPGYECYNFNENTGTIVSYDISNPACSKDVLIPNKIDGVPVEYIGDVAFVHGAKKMCRIDSVYTEVELGYNCTTGYYYNWDNQTEFIESVEFPESLVGIGESAFDGNMLSTVNLGDLINLEYIDEYAFEENQIETVSFANLPNLEYIYDGVFYGNYISSVRLKDLPLLEEIGFEAFSENNITSVTLQNLDSLYVIYGDAFSYNQISTLIMNNLPTLDRMGYEAFAYNNLTSVNLTGAPKLYRMGWGIFTDNNISSINLSGLTLLESIGERSFSNNLLTSVTIPENVIGIGEAAFSGNPITTVNILGSNIYRFNDAWAYIGFPSGVMPIPQITAQSMTLSTASPNNFIFSNYTYYKATVPTTGSYRLEVWGAQGNYNGGLGGYSSGRISLNAGDILYVYVGQIGQPDLSSWNGGGSSYGDSYFDNGGGGGATDIRLVSGNWSDSAGLNSRIIVAGGGGGGRTSAGYGGGLVGGDCATVGTGGTQSAGGTGYNGGTSSGSFGIGGWYTNSDDNPGGGGGWYGGGIKSDSGGGGGSGYVLTSLSGKPSGYNPDPRFYMTEEQLIAGNTIMPNPSGGTMTGNTGDGYARITYLGA